MKNIKVFMSHFILSDQHAKTETKTIVEIKSGEVRN